MRVLESQIEIAATAEHVWAVLTDFPAFAGWNPFITSISGAPAAGARLAVRIQPPGGRAMAFKPRVTAAEPDRHLAWLGRLGLPRVFDGAHEFLIEPNERGGVSFTQRETFRGILVPFVGKVLGRTHHGFDLMNHALKERAESAGTRVAGSDRDHPAQSRS
jgi:hypothetical protein